MNVVPRPPGKRPVLRGAAMALALQWAMRAMGLISLVVLARLLSPTDFGVIGLAMTAVALVELFSYVGLRQALLRMEAPDRSYLDTAWTIQLGLFTTLGCVLAALSQPVAAFYGEPAVGPVLLALSLRFVLLGAVNIGTVEFDREFRFGRDLAMRMAGRVVSLAVSIAMALWLRSYWALVAGLLTQSLCFLIASYVMHPYRPRFSLRRRAELAGTSLWLFFGIGAQIVQDQVDRVALGRTGSADELGAFTVSKDLSAIFTQEIATALNRVSFVETSRAGALSGQGGRIGPLLAAYAAIAAPMGLGLAAVAGDFFAVFLGGQWSDAARITALLAPAGAVYAVYKLVASSLQAGGRERLAAFVTLGGVSLNVLTVGAVLAVGRSDPMAIASATLTGCALTLMTGIVVLAREARADAVAIIADVARPFLAAVAMYAAIVWLPWPANAPIVALAIEVPLGALVYAAAVWVLWTMAGRPRGIELTVAERLPRAVRALRAKAVSRA